MNEKAWKILFPPHSLSVESRALVSLWSDVWLGLRLFRFPRTKQATSIHPLQNRWLYVSCWKNFCFCSADSDVDFIFIFMKNPFWFFWSVDPFFFSPISFAHHADKSECLRLQFFLFWVSHVQHVHTDERQNLRSIFLLAASNSLNWVWPARKSFANTSF